MTCRLFPAVLFALFFYTFIWQWAGAGPTYPIIVGDATNCRTNWWVDLLMLHNVLNRDYFVSLYYHWWIGCHMTCELCSDWWRVVRCCV